LLNIPPPSVTLSTSGGEISVHRGYSSKQLDRKLGGHSSVKLRAGWVTRGLTKTKLESWIKVSVIYRKLGIKRNCIGLESVSVQVGYPHFNIYIARKLKPGSCAYKTTMAHERKHVSIYRDQLQTFLPVFEQHLNQTAKKLMPIIYNSPKAGNKYFLRKLNTEFKRVLKQMNNETKRLHGRMDTPKNYQKEQSLCPNS
jgi:hypothetical protein